MAWGGHCLSLGLQFPSESCNQAFATQRTDLSWPIDGLPNYLIGMADFRFI